MGASGILVGRRCSWQGLHVENVVRIGGLHVRLGSPSSKTRLNTNLAISKSIYELSRDGISARRQPLSSELAVVTTFSLVGRFQDL